MNNDANVLKKVEQTLLYDNGLDIPFVEKLLSNLSSRDIDFGDIYFSYSVADGWAIDEGILKDGSFMIAQGFGIRGVKGTQTAFAYSDEITERALNQTIKAASSIAKMGQTRTVALNRTIPLHQMYPDVDPVFALSRERKMEILKEIDQFVRSLDTRVIQVNASISSSYKQNLILTTDGRIGADIKPIARLRCSVIVEDNGRKESGHDAFGMATGFDFLEELVPVLPNDYIEDITAIDSIQTYEKRYLAVARGALRLALKNLQAQQIAAGTMPIVLSSGWPAVLIHEAVGHGLEADAIRKGASIFKERVGQKVASELCTIIDDGTIANRPGSSNFDSEGTLTQKNVLIADGTLQGYMYDRQNALLMGKMPTGNGRRSSYKRLPIPRMTNTYLQAGTSEPKDIIASLERGIYAVNFSGGQVDPASGNFTFSADEAYYVENGQVQYPVKGVTLIGNGMETLKNITMVGNKLTFDRGIGHCGKAGQTVSVGIGQPMIRVEDVTVGGT